MCDVFLTMGGRATMKNVWPSDVSLGVCVMNKVMMSGWPKQMCQNKHFSVLTFPLLDHVLWSYITH